MDDTDKPPNDVAAVLERADPFSVPFKNEQLLHRSAWKSVKRWLVKAPPGATRCYHIGSLWNDRDENITTNTIGDAMWQAHLDGLVKLTQHRVGNQMFEYLATRTAKPWKEAG